MLSSRRADGSSALPCVGWVSSVRTMRRMPAGVIAPDTRTEAFVQWIDLLPTLIEAAAGEVPDGLDGTRIGLAGVDEYAQYHSAADVRDVVRDRLLTQAADAVWAAISRAY